VKFTTWDPRVKPDKALPILDSEPNEEVSLENLMETGFKFEPVSALHGAGVVYFLVEQDGKLAWFPLRYD
jgi:hypothetical protein